MKTMKKNSLYALAASAAFAVSLGVSAASASTVTITFDDLDGDVSGGNPKTYTSQGYEFVPVNLNADTKCASGLCTKEAGQTDLPTMTRTDDGAFSLYGFYFSIIGGEAGAANYITVEGFTGAGTTIDPYVSTGTAIKFRLDTLLSGYPASQNVTVAYTNLSGANAACSQPGDDPATTLCKNYGYTADLSLTGLFNNVTKVEWASYGSAQGLIDDIVASGDPGGGVIPLPAGLPLLLSAIGIGGLISRRKRKAA